MNAAASHMHPDADHAAPFSEDAVQEADTSWLPQHFEGEEPVPAGAADSPYRRVVAGFLILLAVLWIGTVAWAAGQASNPAAPASSQLVGWAAAASGPLALLGLGWLLFGRSTRAETSRFVRSVQQMRIESDALHATLAQVGAQIAANRAALADESVRLIGLGEEAADRLTAVTRDVDAGANAMARYAEQLDRAAGSARTDMGVLLADLPKAEAQARHMAETLRAAGIDAHSQAASLEAQMAALVHRAREADESAGGAAGRLTAHIVQVQSAAETASGEMERATAAMTAGVDGVLAQAAAAVDATRQGVEEQGRAMLAAAEQGGAAFDRLSAEAGERLSARLAEIHVHAERIGTEIAAQDAAARLLVGTVETSLGELETRLPALVANGEGQLQRLGATVAELRAALDAMGDAAAGSDVRIDALAARSQALRELLGSIEAQLGEVLPASLGEVEARTERSRVATEALTPQVAQLEQATIAASERLHAAAQDAQARLAQATGQTGTRLAEAEALLMRQAEAMDALTSRVGGELNSVHAQIAALGAVVTEADTSAERLARDTGPQLIEALLRVREAALQAAERAREAIATAIPDAAAQLGHATGAAMQQAIAGQVSAQMEELGPLAERAVEAARAASERLTRQIITIGETTAAVEGRIAEAQEEIREADSENFSRRVSLLIESLNSTAIDVAKILSNDVTDAAWAQYLKGDRGVFTRRAVRLLDAGEAREIARHYEEEPEFREQVNRYVHDFEALLRHVLAQRDGSPLGVTLLSSDMGKLYVALAQGIERLRA